MREFFELIAQHYWVALFLALVFLSAVALISDAISKFRRK